MKYSRMKMKRRDAKKQQKKSTMPSIGQQWGQLLAAVDTAEVQLTYADFSLLSQDVEDHALRVFDSLRRLGIRVRAEASGK